jgi:PPIC-type PPIASE domain
VKRFLVLLIVLAGGLAAAAFAVPTNAATVNGTSISQERLNSDLDAIGNSTSYQCYLNAQELVGTQGQTGLPAFYGVGSESGSHPTVTATYASNYLDTLIGHQLVFDLADQKSLQITSQDLTAAHAELVAQMTEILQEVASSQYQCTVDGQSATAATVLATMPTSFVNQNVQFDATVTALEENEAGISTAADLERYFNAHASEFDTACFTVAEYSSQADAEAAAMVAAGTPFAQVAAQAGGGPQQPCSILYGLASSLPAGSNLQSLPVNQVSSPIALSSTEYALLQITSRTPTSFPKAKSEVQAAVQAAGATKARAAVNAAEKNASIAVDQRYGEWVSSRALIVPPPSPPPGGLLNSAANSPATTTTPSASSGAASNGSASSGSTSSGTTTTPSGQTP